MNVCTTHYASATDAARGRGLHDGVSAAFGGDQRRVGRDLRRITAFLSGPRRGLRLAREIYWTNHTATVADLAKRFKASPYLMRDALTGRSFRNELEPPIPVLRPEPDLK